MNDNEGFFVAFFTFVLAGVTGWLVYATAGLREVTAELVSFAGEQARDMKASIAVAITTANAAQQSARSAEAANHLTRDMFIAEQRPWLRWAIPKVCILKRNGPNLTFSVEGTLTNIGRLPATEIVYFGKLYAPATTQPALNPGHAFFAEQMQEIAKIPNFALAAALPAETIPMRFGPNGVEVDTLPNVFTLWFAFHCKYIYSIGVGQNAASVAEIGTIYMVQPIGGATTSFNKGEIVDSETPVALVEFPGQRRLT
jgi:hypothetical protein